MMVKEKKKKRREEEPPVGVFGVQFPSAADRNPTAPQSPVVPEVITHSCASCGS